MYTDRYLSEVAEGIKRMVSTINGNIVENEYAIEVWVDESKKRRDLGGVFFFAGNGASATMAEHLSHDCFQNADMLTYTVSETSHLTAISNDISYESVFAYRIEKAATQKDMLITISSSGNSPNIINAIKTAKAKGLQVVTLSGKSSDNKSRQFGDVNFYVPLETYGLVESAHACLLHAWLDRFLDKYMGGRH